MEKCKDRMMLNRYCGWSVQADMISVKLERRLIWISQLGSSLL